MRPPLPPFASLWQRLPWPLPAVLAWAAGWLVWAAARASELSPAAALASGLLACSALAWLCRGPWRRALALAGFPMSALVLTGAGSLPPWLWLLLLLPLLTAYPLRAWRDAPFFPTPHDALAGLPQLVGTPRRVLDAGSGLGHGLAALHRLWPQAELAGLEWSPLLAWASRWRCRFARVQRGDMWAASWAGHDLVYVFQRPESMPRVWQKACAELPPGAWLVSLEFAVPGQPPTACLHADGLPGSRPVWAYRMEAGPARSNMARRRR